MEQDFYVREYSWRKPALLSGLQSNLDKKKVLAAYLGGPS
jgi:hypothetical protein